MPSIAGEKSLLVMQGNVDLIEEGKSCTIGRIEIKNLLLRKRPGEGARAEYSLFSKKRVTVSLRNPAENHGHKEPFSHCGRERRVPGSGKEKGFGAGLKSSAHREGDLCG